MLESIAPGWLATGGALLGAILGSFIAALCVRWPEGRSVIRGRSSCDDCGYQPKPHEMVPILSWVALSGRCSQCKASIDRIHPLAEFAGAVIGGAAFLLLPVPQAAIYALFGWLALPLILLDFRHHWLPDRLTLLLALAGLAVLVWARPDDLLLHLAASAIAFALLEGMRRYYRHIRNVEGMGEGDPKLIGAITLWTGPYLLPAILLLASGGGLIWYLLAGKRAPERFPLGALMLLGALVALPFGLN